MTKLSSIFPLGKNWGLSFSTTGEFQQEAERGLGIGLGRARDGV